SRFGRSCRRPCALRGDPRRHVSQRCARPDPGAGPAAATERVGVFAMIRQDSRRGVVLIAELWSIALLSALAMAASTTFRGFAGIMGVDRDRVQAEALLTAGLEAAAGYVDSLGQTPLTNSETAITLTTGTVRAFISDETGRIDIGQAPVEVLAGLLASV